MKATQTLLFLAATASVSVALTCNHDNALDWSIITAGSTTSGSDDGPVGTNGGSSGSSSSGDGPVGTNGGSSSTCAGSLACSAIASDGACNSQALIDGGNCVRRRDTDIECTTAETCFLYTDGQTLCLNMETGEYHDEAGGNGNAISGVYTAANGTVQTVTETAASATRTPLTGTTADADTSTTSSSHATSTGTRSSAAAAPNSSGLATTAAAAASSASQSSAAVAQSSSAANGAVGVQALLLALAPMPLVAALL